MLLLHFRFVTSFRMDKRRYLSDDDGRDREWRFARSDLLLTAHVTSRFEYFRVWGPSLYSDHHF